MEQDHREDCPPMIGMKPVLKGPCNREQSSYLQKALGTTACITIHASASFSSYRESTRTECLIGALWYRQAVLPKWVLEIPRGVIFCLFIDFQGAYRWLIFVCFSAEKGMIRQIRLADSGQWVELSENLCASLHLIIKNKMRVPSAMSEEVLNYCPHLILEKSQNQCQTTKEHKMTALRANLTQGMSCGSLTISIRCFSRLGQIWSMC